MKLDNILVPSDFSSYAQYAFDASLKLAKIHKADVHVHHTADIPVGWEELAPRDQDADKKNLQKVEGIIQKMAKYTDQGMAENIKVTTSYVSGKLITNLRSIVLEQSIDLIMMGSHGLTAREEFLMGSNAQNVIRKLHVPVLVIKRPIQELRFTRVAFSSGLDQADQEAFKRFIEFVEPFHPEEIHLIAVDTADYFNQPTIFIQKALEIFANLAKPHKCQTHFYRDYSVEAGIRHFSNERQIDLIGISNIKRHPLKRLFQQSNVERLANRAEIPVLTIDFDH